MKCNKLLYQVSYINRISIVSMKELYSVGGFQLNQTDINYFRLKHGEKIYKCILYQYVCIKYLQQISKYKYVM